MNILIGTLLLVVGLISTAGATNAGQIEGQGAADTDTLAIEQSDSTTKVRYLTDSAHCPRVIAYYFHGEFRCENCLRTEGWTESTIRAAFAKELGDSTLLWSAINIDEPEHEHFIDDFKLSNRSVILVELEGREQKRWKNLEAVWDLLDNEKAFRLYIRDEIQNYLDCEGERRHDRQ